MLLRLNFFQVTIQPSSMKEVRAVGNSCDIFCRLEMGFGFLQILSSFLVLSKEPLECIVLLKNPTTNDDKIQTKIQFQDFWPVHLFNTLGVGGDGSFREFWLRIFFASDLCKFQGTLSYN